MTNTSQYSLRRKEMSEKTMVLQRFDDGSIRTRVVDASVFEVMCNPPDGFYRAISVKCDENFPTVPVLDNPVGRVTKIENENFDLW